MSSPEAQVAHGLQIDQPSAETLLINGAWRAAPRTFEVMDPATLELVGHAADGDAAAAREALDAACAVAETWRGVDAEARSGYLRAAAAEIRASVGALAELLTVENGKPLAESRVEITSCARMLEWSAEEGRRANGRVLPSSSNGPGLVLKAPIGPTLAISPWNFPASMAIRKIGLALAAGCPIILKPAEQTPFIAVALVRIIDAAGLPPGVLQVLTTSDPASVVGALLEDDRLRKVTFTGSTDVGLGLVRGTGTTLRRMSLEMGGHSPGIIFADADLDAAAVGVVGSKFSNAGQSCIAINRLYVHRDIHDDLVARIVERASKLNVGHGGDEATNIGPLIDETAMAKVERHVEDAVAQGAKVVLGGQRSTGPMAGAFYEPTVLTGATDDMLISNEETFGPVLPVYSFDDDSAAIAGANRTAYGLAAYVFGTGLDRIWNALDRLNFGIIGVNDVTPVRPELPFGGMKNSGQEREGGSEGIEAFLETKSVALKLGGTA